MKDHLKRKFLQWYAQEVPKQLQTTPLSQVKVEVTLKVVKSSWIMSGWHALEKRPKIVVNGFRKSRILELINCNTLKNSYLLTLNLNIMIVLIFMFITESIKSMFTSRHTVVCRAAQETQGVQTGVNILTRTKK